MMRRPSLALLALGLGLALSPSLGYRRSPPTIMALQKGPRQGNPLNRFWTRLTRGDGLLTVPDEKFADVVVVGAGMAGLICARKLAAAGKSVTVLEGSDGVGGRIRSDKVDGYILDRGFQVFIEQYPESKAELDYSALGLKQFEPGAVVRREGGFYTVTDPFRRPVKSLGGVTAPVGTLVDKLLVAYLSLRLQIESVGEILQKPEVDTEEYLRTRRGFSPVMVEAFFRPFLSGIFLAPLSLQSSRMFEFVFKMFSEGAAALPRNGMGAVPQQVYDGLPDGTVKLNTTVAAIDGRGRGVALENGTVLGCDAVVIATDAPACAKLLKMAQVLGDGEDDGVLLNEDGRSSTCLYFTTDGPPPVKDPILVLNGESDGGLVNNVCFPSAVQSNYAPEGKTLVSVTVVGMPPAAGGGTRGAAESLERRVRDEMTVWFGEEEIEKWEFLALYTFPYAQPAQTPPNDFGFSKSSAVADGIYVCGDHRDTPTLNGAILSGKVTAAEVLEDLESQALQAAAGGAGAEAAGER
mmetsp:Transcript_30240/g.96459  ORF Transcript_30240/g.96459 Transcript_30240/m.96459 type:complete len:522 (-) Transcript_30240:191-1756(-)